MNGEKNRQRQRRGHSFKWQLLAGLVLSTIGILVIYVIFMRLENDVYYEAVYEPPVYIIYDYTDELVAEHYDSIPVQDMNGNAFIVFDKDGNIVYQSEKGLNIPYESAVFLHESIIHWSENSVVVMEAMYGYDRHILTDTYMTADGQERLVVELYSYNMDFNLEEAMEKSRSVTILGAICGALWVVLIALFLGWRFKRAIKPVDDAIMSYQQGVRPDYSGQTIPLEYQGVLDDLNSMMDKVEQAEEERKKAEQSRNRMIADLSHDLKTPLTVISGYSGAMLDGVIPEQDKESYLRIIHQKALYTSVLMDDLFEYSKMEHPDYKPNLEQLDYCEFCREYLGEKYTELEMQGFVIQAQIPEEPILWQIDRVLFRRLLENLIMNIQKHNAPGTNIYFQVAMEEEQLVTLVADDGTGISSKVAEHIFEPFVKGDEARASGRGTGLGMAVSRTIVGLHNGSIELVYPPQEPYSTQIVIRLNR